MLVKRVEAQDRKVRVTVLLGRYGQITRLTRETDVDWHID